MPIAPVVGVSIGDVTTDSAILFLDISTTKAKFTQGDLSILCAVSIAVITFRYTANRTVLIHTIAIFTAVAMHLVGVFPLMGCIVAHLLAGKDAICALVEVSTRMLRIRTLFAGFLPLLGDKYQATLGAGVGGLRTNDVTLGIQNVFVVFLAHGAIHGIELKRCDGFTDRTTIHGHRTAAGSMLGDVDLDIVFHVIVVVGVIGIAVTTHGAESVDSYTIQAGFTLQFIGFLILVRFIHVGFFDLNDHGIAAGNTQNAVDFAFACSGHLDPFILHILESAIRAA